MIHSTIHSDVLLLEDLKLRFNVIVCFLDVFLTLRACEYHLATCKDKRNDVILCLLLRFIQHVAIDESWEVVIVCAIMFVILVVIDLIE